MPLIATDLDGTLLMSGTHTPHPDAVAAVHQALGAGIPVVFATGRSPADVLPIADLVGHRWFAVCCDGTAIVDLRTEEVIRTHPLAYAEKVAVVDRLRDKFPDVKFLIDSVRTGKVASGRHGLVVEDGFEAPWAWALDGARGVRDISTAIEDPDVVKVCAFLPRDGQSAKYFNSIKETVVDLVDAVRIHSDRTFVDMNVKGISKATGVAELAELEGIDREHVFAVGDMHNDVELLRWAGRAFAVENALPHVHDAADIIVPSNDAGGVAQVVAAALQHLRES